MSKFVFVGDILTPVSNGLRFLNGYIKVEDGLITELGSNEIFCSKKNAGNYNDIPIHYLKESQFLMPGFVDCHTHAPQYPNIGLGLDRPLLEWLDKYTFPLEAQYSDNKFAAKVYDKVVKRLIKNGTTTACYYGSLHLEGTLELVKSVVKHQQRALVGKVSMNMENDAGYYNKTRKELEEVQTFLETVYGYQNKLVEPIITPRFAVSCDRELMTHLSNLARTYRCRIQSHISENQKEIEFVLQMYNDCSNYTEVYERCGFFDSKCIMAHAVFLSDSEMSTFARKGVAVAHCPASNTRLKSGLCPVRRLLDNHIRVGLGTDVSGGDSSSILDALRRAMDVSEHLRMTGAKESALDWKEALYLATAGGANALYLEDKIGFFEANYSFDALVIDVNASNGPIDNYSYSVDRTNAIAEKAQKFVYCGDDRNIVQVYINGRKVKDLL